MTRQRRDLTDLAFSPAEAERVHTTLLAQLDERRNPRTKATVTS